MRAILAVLQRCSRLACAALAAGIVIGAASSRAADLCAAPDDLTANIAPLPHVAAALKGGTLNVLTVGSATVFSPDETLTPGTVTGLALGLGNTARPAGELPMPSEAAFPMRMAQALRQENPGLTVSVTVRGGRGMMASEMLQMIRQEIASRQFQLVIWQTGTVEAVRNVPPGEFYQTLSDGEALIGQAGADLVLVDPQFSRFLHANVQLEPYAQAMQEIAALPDTILFHRFGLMRYWVNEGEIDLERTPKGERVKTVEALHACLGSKLAQMILSSAHQPS